MRQPFTVPSQEKRKIHFVIIFFGDQNLIDLSREAEEKQDKILSLQQQVTRTK